MDHSIYFEWLFIIFGGTIDECIVMHPHTHRATHTRTHTHTHMHTHTNNEIAFLETMETHGAIKV